MKTITRFKLRTILKDEVYKLQEKEEPFDLLSILEKEINLLGLKNNSYAIARYIYIRLGELFEYDVGLEYATEEKKEKLKRKRVNIRNVTDFSIICDSYAYMYVELLNHFGIPAKVVDTKAHVYVIYNIDEKTYLADLTSGNEDITRIKFGLKPNYNRQIHPIAPKEDTTFDEIDKMIYINGISTEEGLNFLKEELELKKRQEKWSQEEYTYQVFKIIEMIMNFKRKSIGFVSGVTYIYYLLNFFIEQYEMNHTHFLNQEDGLEMELFLVKKDNNIIYFSYQKEKDSFYSFHKISELELTVTVRNKNLKLIKKKKSA